MKDELKNEEKKNQTQNMDSKQLLDSLTSHIALYHSSLSSLSLSKNPRTSILRWFSALSIPHRQASLTVVDLKFAQILLKMRNRIQSNGHGSFILLPDLPSRYSLPSLCFRKSRGLLSRSAAAAASDRSIYDSIRLFSSGSSEKCGCSLVDIDSCTVSEEFVADVDRFVEAMDRVSDGGFLRGEEKDLGSDWFEFSWLKAKGYYGLEAFVANKLELALRLSWINFNCAKRRGPKRKEKAAGDAGVAANVFWRKKGCLDWWDRLDPRVRKKILRTFLGKTAKSLAHEIVKEANDASRDEMWFFSVGLQQPLRYGPTESHQRTDADLCSGIVPASVSVHTTSLANVSSSLLVLQQISVIILACENFNNESDKLFFSTLDSLHTVSDCILRRVHVFLMKLSSDYTNLELLGDESLKASANKSKGRTKSRGRKLKKHNPLRKSCEPEALPEENGCGLDNEEENSPRLGYINDNVSMEVATTTLSAEKGFCQSTSLSGSMMELLEEVVNGKVETTTIRSGKEYPKYNKSHCQGVGDGDQDHSITGTTSSVTSLCGLPAFYELPDVSTSLSQSNDFCSCDNPPPNSGDCEAAEKPRLEVHTAVANGIEDDPVMLCSPPEVPANKGFEHHNSNTSDSSLRSGSPKLNEVVDKDVTSLVQEKEPKDYYTHGPPSFLGGISYEWPNLAPAVYFPSVNSRHLPTATDRLHLDVGHNWQNHLHQPFLPMGRQPRNTLVEAGFSRMLPSHTLPVSLDWPLTVDSSDIKTGPDLADDSESSHWTTEEECEVRAISCRDYNQFFGGGIMYWNTSEHGGTGFSGPPSLSSEDSSWAWHEADLNRAIDDMVGLSTSYCGKGLASPTSASFCSSFDPMGPTHQPLGYVIPGSDLTVKDVMAEETLPGSLTKSPGAVAEGLTGDSLPYPILRPIIVPNISRKWSRSEFMLSHDHKSPCVPATRRDPPRIKRPPSPVVLCVPQPPGNPPPSPVGESRKQRGFPGVRSGSSSPRNWGMRSWYHEGTNCEEARICVDGPEVIWSSWRSKGLGPAQMMQPVPGTLPQDCLIAISQLALDQEHPDVALPLHPPDLQNSAARKLSLSMMHNLLHEEIDSFCKQVAAENLIRKPYISWAVKRVARSLQVLWPRSRTNIFGSNATGLALPTSDVDLVVRLPPVRNLEPIKEAGILEGRNGIKETCLQHAARYLANQEWVKNDSLKTVENTAIPIIMLVAEIPKYLVTSNGSSIGHIMDLDSNHVIREQGSVTHRSDNVSWPLGSKMKNSNGTDVKYVRLDISFKSPSHTGLQTTELVRDLTDQFPAAAPLALVLKQFLADRSLDHSYSGGLSSYCLVLLITRFLQHEHHVTRAINQNLGSLLMDFLYFFGNVFDPRQMRISIQGSGIYVNRERGHCIDPIHIDDPLYPTNNVGRNCFRIHQCIKAFADAYAVLDNELAHLPSSVDDPITKSSFKLLPKIIPSINLV